MTPRAVAAACTSRRENVAVVALFCPLSPAAMAWADKPSVGCKRKLLMTPEEKLKKTRDELAKEGVHFAPDEWDLRLSAPAGRTDWVRARLTHTRARQRP